MQSSPAILKLLRGSKCTQVTRLEPAAVRGEAVARGQLSGGVAGMPHALSVVGGPLPVHAQVTGPFARLTRGKRSRLAVGSLRSWPSEGGRPASECVRWGQAPKTQATKCHWRPRRSKQRPAEHIKHSHSFQYTENSSNLFQNCLVSS